MATPFLLLLFSPQEAIQMNLILSLVISIALIREIKADIDFTLLKRFSIGSVIGVPFGILIFLSIDITVFKLIVSIILLLFTMLLILQFKMKGTPQRDFMIGGFSGLFTSSIGMPGPPLLVYFTGTNIEKEKLRATTLAYFLFIYFISLIIQIVFSGTEQDIWLSSLYAIPIVFIGLFIGQKLFKKLNQRTFRLFIYILLICTGIYLLIDSISSYW